MKTKTIRKTDYRIAASVMRYPTEATALCAIIGQIERFWLRKDIALVPLEDGLSWSVRLGGKLHETARVIRQGTTYHFTFPA